MPARLSQMIKSILQHQPWREHYSLSVTGLLEHDKPVQKRIGTQLQLIDRSVQIAFLFLYQISIFYRFI